MLTRSASWKKIRKMQNIFSKSYVREDQFFTFKRFFHRYIDEYNRVLNSPAAKTKINQFAGLMRNLTKLTGKKIERLVDLYFLYQTFMAESSLGLPLPEWAYDYFPYGGLFDGIVAEYEITNFTPLLRRLYSGELRSTYTLKFWSVSTKLN